MLPEGNINFRPNRFVKIVHVLPIIDLPRVFDDAHDLQDSIGNRSSPGASTPIFETNLLPKRVLAGKVRSRKTLVYDCDAGRDGTILLRKQTAFTQGGARDREIRWRDRAIGRGSNPVHVV